MKKSQNLVLYFVSVLALLVASVSCVARQAAPPGVLYSVAAGLGAAALGLAGSDLLKQHRGEAI